MARFTFLSILLISGFFCSAIASVEFTMNDRQVTENDGPCNVDLIKQGNLVEDVTLRVRALTIEQYESLTGNTFTPNDIPHAEAEDFDNSYEETFIFEATGSFRETRLVEVAVANDDVNELNEEFLLFFDILNNTTDTIVTSPDRNPVRCRIMNDDPVTVSFDQNSHTVPEGSNLEDTVFITKVDGSSTEEDIEISITVIPQSATLGGDFTTPNNEDRFTLTFSAGQDRIGIPINVPSNDVNEGERTFRLLFSASSPTSLLQKDITFTDITIEDTTPLPPLPSPVASVVPPPSTNDPQLTNVPQLTTNLPQTTTTNFPQTTTTNFPQATTTTFPQATNVPQETGVPPECEEKDDKDISLAIGLTFLITFLLTALCAVVIICFVVIADRKRRHHSHEQLS